MLASLDILIARLEAEIAAEAGAIAAAVAAHQIGAGYWQALHRLRRRLDAAQRLRQALEEVLR